MVVFENIDNILGHNMNVKANTFRYNYKQARNMVANGDFELVVDVNGILHVRHWSAVEGSSLIKASTFKPYRSTYGLQSSGVSYQEISQPFPQIYAGRKYFCCYIVTSRSNAGNNTHNMKLRDRVSGTEYSLVGRTGTTTTGWQYSVWTSPINSLNMDLRFSCTNSSIIAQARYDRFIIVDLTDTFGAGNEPDADWVMNTMVEKDCIVNIGQCINQEEFNLTRNGMGSNHYYNPLSLDSHWEPRDGMLMFTPDLNPRAERSHPEYAANQIPIRECYLRGTSSYEYGRFYYASYECIPDWNDGNVVGRTADLYMPEKEPSVACGVTLCRGDVEGFNGGGGMAGWKRAALHGLAMVNEKHDPATVRFDFNHENKPHTYRISDIGMIDCMKLGEWMQENGWENPVVNCMHPAFLERYVRNKTLSVIRIPDPSKKYVQFGSSHDAGDIIANDIIPVGYRDVSKGIYITDAGQICAPTFSKEKLY